MNTLVDKWNRHQSKARYVGSDSVFIGDETVHLEIRKPDVKEKVLMSMPDNVKLSVDRPRVLGMVFFGSEEEVVALAVMTRDCLVNLGVKLGTETVPFKHSSKIIDQRPNFHDVGRFLTAVGTGDEKYKKDRKFVKRLFATLLTRVSAEFAATLVDVEGD